MAQFSNKSLIATIRGLSKNESGFGKSQAQLVVEALEGTPLTDLYKSHALRCVNRFLKSATKKETIARLEAVKAQIEGVKPLGRYTHASSLDAAE